MKNPVDASNDKSNTSDYKNHSESLTKENWSFGKKVQFKGNANKCTVGGLNNTIKINVKKSDVRYTRKQSNNKNYLYRNSIVVKQSTMGKNNFNNIIIKQEDSPTKFDVNSEDEQQNELA